jgi:hypothetical protein
MTNKHIRTHLDTCRLQTHTEVEEQSSHFSTNFEEPRNPTAARFFMHENHLKRLREVFDEFIHCDHDVSVLCGTLGGEKSNIPLVAKQRLLGLVEGQVAAHGGRKCCAPATHVLWNVGKQRCVH